MKLEKLSEEEIEMLIRKGRRMLFKTQQLKKFLNKQRPHVTVSDTERYDTIRAVVLEVETFFGLLNEEKTKKVSDLLSEFTTVDTLYATLSSLEEKIHEILDILEIRFKPQLSIKEKQVLQGFREELEELKKLGLKDYLLKNLHLSIEELERPNYCTSSMLSARTTIYMTEKIEGKDDENKIKKLQDLGIIDKGEKSKQTVKFFLDAVRSARNFILHDAEFFPGPSDSHGYVAGAFKMAKLYSQYSANSQG